MFKRAQHLNLWIINWLFSYCQTQAACATRSFRLLLQVLQLKVLNSTAKWGFAKFLFQTTVDRDEVSGVSKDSEKCLFNITHFQILPLISSMTASPLQRSFLRTLAYFFPLSPAKFFSLGLPSIVYEGCRIQKRCLVVRMKEAQASQPG